MIEVSIAMVQIVHRNAQEDRIPVIQVQFVRGKYSDKR